MCRGERRNVRGRRCPTSVAPRVDCVVVVVVDIAHVVLHVVIVIEDLIDVDIAVAVVSVTVMVPSFPFSLPSYYHYGKIYLSNSSSSSSSSSSVRASAATNPPPLPSIPPHFPPQPSSMDEGDS